MVVELRDVRHDFRRGDKVLTVLAGIDLDVEAGDFVSLVGPSGCGKSTLLRVICGLLKPSGGTIRVKGQRVDDVRTDVGYMFQTDALLPWRTVLDNVALPLKFRGDGRREREELAREWIGTVGLRGFEDSFPHQLSGGMRKRVSLACTLVSSPDLILMDEPFSALDVQTRNMMENELMAIWARDKKTVLFVTHDLEEAIGLSDKVVVMSARPARVKAIHDITLERPRNILEVRTQLSFHSLYTRLWDDMRDEVLAGYRDVRG